MESITTITGLNRASGIPSFPPLRAKAERDGIGIQDLSLDEINEEIRQARGINK
jgi:hypothetical protein